MGPVLTKIKKKKRKKSEIHSFNDVGIPDGYKMIKMATYNINLKNSINLKYRVRRVIDFINSNYKDKQIDILCLQGIHDYTALEVLINNIQKKFWANKLYTAPTYDDIVGNIDVLEDNILTISSIITGSLRSTIPSKNNTIRNIEIQNLIISRFPIVSTIFNDMDTSGRIDDVIGIKSVIGANIDVNGLIISVYSTCLSKDIKLANLNNAKLRNKEAQRLFNTIAENERNVNKLQNYEMNNIHLILGTFNINYMKGKDISSEFSEFVTAHNCIDVYKYINPKKDGFTNTEKERMDYTFIRLTDDIFVTPKWKKIFDEVKTDQDLFKFIFKRYDIHFIDCYVRDDLNATNSTTNYPVETVFIIKDYAFIASQLM